ncbi:Nuclear transport factor 2 Eukaryote, partial [Penicillium soppii]|uniref:Nuclear transport factor 2 Eukaryote n=1 Tax=Penicillium soppii TaxID=69789 RepID=UPI0025466CE9
NSAQSQCWVWESQRHQGTDDIINTLTKPGLVDVKSQVISLDATPSAGEGVLVSNQKIDRNYDKPLPFSVTFQLMPIPGQPGGFFVYSQIFRLRL